MKILAGLKCVLVIFFCLSSEVVKRWCCLLCYLLGSTKHGGITEAGSYTRFSRKERLLFIALKKTKKFKVLKQSMVGK